MMRGLDDTDAEVSRVHLELLRRASPSRRLSLALSLSRTVMTLSKQGIARTLPGATPDEIDERFVAVLYGEPLAAEIRASRLAPRR